MRQKMMLDMMRPEETRRRTNGWVVAGIVVLVVGIVAALAVVLLRKRGGATTVPTQPKTATLAKGAQVTSKQMAQFTMKGMNMVGYTSGDRINYATATVGAAGPGVVGGTIELGSSKAASFTWTPEAPPKGAAGPTTKAPGAGSSFVPGTLSIVVGSGVLRTTLYLAPNTATGQVGWTEDKTYVGLYPTGASQNTFYLAFLSRGTQAATYGVPQNDSKAFVLTPTPSKGFFVAFVATGANA